MNVNDETLIDPVTEDALRSRFFRVSGAVIVLIIAGSAAWSGNAWAALVLIIAGSAAWFGDAWAALVLIIAASAAWSDNAWAALALGFAAGQRVGPHEPLYQILRRWYQAGR